MKDYILEVCVDSVESALEAKRGGATRLELCANLVIGGTTPGYTLFEQVKKEVRELSDSHGKYREHATKYYRNLGQITHYIADYFTFPHNRTYPGNLKDHCSYEEVLKLRLREYLKTDKKDRWPFVQCHFGSAEALCDFIKLRHEEYLRRKIDVEEDIRHIVSLNYQVVEGIRQLAEQGKLHQYLSKKRAA